jgi:hypothetical protein
MTTYKEIPTKIRYFEDFKGSSVSAILIAQNTYKVYSYDTLIFEYNYDKSEVKYFDNGYYSNTTSKLQNILIDVFNLNNGKKKRG